MDEESGGPNAPSRSKTLDAKTGQPMRDWTALLGGFEAQRLNGDGKPEGERYRSGVCFLPNYVVDTVAGQLTSEVPEVRFAFDIGAHFDEDSATSYIFDAVSLIEPKADDPLATLMMQVGSTKIAAPEPKTLDQHQKEKVKAK